MIIRACGSLSIPQTSLIHQISENPSTDVLVGFDRELPREVASGPAFNVGQGQQLYKVNALALSNRDKLIGKSIDFAELGLSSAEQGLLLSGLDMPNGSSMAFKSTTVIIAGVDVIHVLTKDDKNAIEIAVASTKAIALLADLVAPVVPFLRNYQQQLKFITVLLKTAGATKDIIALTSKASNLDSLRAQ